MPFLNPWLADLHGKIARNPSCCRPQDIETLLRGVGYERSGRQCGSHAVYVRGTRPPQIVPLDCNPLPEDYVFIILDLIAETLENVHEGSA